MNNTQFNSIVRLRRDNDFNYEKIKDKFVPQKGEICLVDTARDGLRAVCGDGKSVFGQLEFVGDLIQKGYFKDGEFYKDNTFTNKIPAKTIAVYIDLATSQLFHFNGNNFEEIGKIATATAKIPGIMKLYDTTGVNTDGTMTQKAITDELNTKVELTLSKDDEELVIFKI